MRLGSHASGLDLGERSTGKDGPSTVEFPRLFLGPPNIPERADLSLSLNMQSVSFFEQNTLCLYIWLCFCPLRASTLTSYGRRIYNGLWWTV